MTAGRRLAYGDYGIYVPLLRFDTSGLPAGATVTSATLKVFVNGSVSADNRKLVGEWVNGATWPLAANDWTLASSGSALAGVAVSSLSSGTVNSFGLSGLGNVAGSGYTTLRLHIDGGAPTGDNYVQFAGYEDGSAPKAPTRPHLDESRRRLRRRIWVCRWCRGRCRRVRCCRLRLGRGRGRRRSRMRISGSVVVRRV